MSLENGRRQRRCVAAKSIRLSYYGGEKTVNSLQRRVLELFDECDSLPPKITRQHGNVEVRTLFTGEEGHEGRMVSLCEFKEVDLLPDDFLVLFDTDSFVKIIPKVDDLVDTATVVERGDLDGMSGDRDGMKVTMDMPFPLSPRITFYYKYSLINRKPDEHMLVLSEVESEHLAAKYNDGEKDYVMARTFLSAYWILPVYGDPDDKTKVTGSHLKYVWSGDMGGFIPMWIQNSGTPKASLDAVKRLVEYITHTKASGGKLDDSE